jgi:hypothetical protein
MTQDFEEKIQGDQLQVQKPEFRVQGSGFRI